MWLGGTLEAKKVTCLKMLSGISRVSRNSSLTQGQEKKQKDTENQVMQGTRRRMNADALLFVGCY